MSRNVLNSKKIYLECFVTRVIEQAIIDAREKMAIKSLKKSSYKDFIKKRQYHLIFDSSFLSEREVQIVYPCYFQHG